jgi:hypothetical protein
VVVHQLGSYDRYGFATALRSLSSALCRNWVLA